MLKRDEGVPGPAVRSHREYSTRPDPTHLAPVLSSISTLQYQGSGTRPELVEPSSWCNAGATTGEWTREDQQCEVFSEIVIIEEDEEDELSSAESNSSFSDVTNRYSQQKPTAPPMGEDKRLFLSNVRNEVDPRGFGGVGSRLQRNNKLVGKRNVGGRDHGNAGGDSDGMMGSGGESDSSEEIHYGPGFVSRLKSRYMSVALRGSGRGTLGSLRRTASLEDFLEIERIKEDEITESGARSPIYKAPNTRPTIGRANNTTAAAYSKVQSRRDSMKRAQSVEVLSILTESSPRRTLTDEFFKAGSRPPSESPPPLPPREKPEQSSVHLVLNSSPALVNDCVIIAERTGPPIAPILPSQTKPSYSRTKHPLGEPRPALKTPSAGVLFGVKDKELPAPDTVKETRKIFETEEERLNNLKFSKSTLITKARSTSSLNSEHGSSPDPAMEIINLSRKKSEEDLERAYLSSRGGKVPAIGTHHRIADIQSTKDPSSAKSATKNSSPRVTRPAIPIKPSHLSPIVTKSNTYRSDKMAINKPLGPKPSPPAPVLESTVKKEKNEVESVRLKPVSTKKTTEPETCPQLELEDGIKKISKDSINNIRRDGHVMNFNFPVSSPASKPYLPGVGSSPNPVGPTSNGNSPYTPSSGVHKPKLQEPSPAVETGGRKVPLASTVVEADGRKGPSASTNQLYTNGLGSPDAKQNKQVGVIKPISREYEAEEIKPRAVIISPDLANNNKHGETKPVTLLPWTSNTQRVINKSTGDKPYSEPNKPVITNPAPQKTPQIISLPEKATPEPEKIPPLGSGPEKTPPSVPPRNGSKLEHSTSPPKPREKYFDTNIEAQPSPPENRRDIGGGGGGGDVTDKSGYRNNWRSRQEQQNTVVFNFINTKKDVSHIENDGLDLTNRSSNKKGVVYLDANGETCDGLSEEETETDLLINFVFLGANITVGKSSIRTKTSSKKMSITWKDETEVFEYPSFESCRDEEPEQDLAPSKSLKSNTPAGTAGNTGGLGSYTPSKIQLSETPFQLGVSRSKPSTPVSSDAPPSLSSDPCLLPVDQGISWGSSASSDILF